MKRILPFTPPAPKPLRDSQVPLDPEGWHKLFLSRYEGRAKTEAVTAQMRKDIEQRGRLLIAAGNNVFVIGAMTRELVAKVNEFARSKS